MNETEVFGGWNHLLKEYLLLLLTLSKRNISVFG
jgi:hypothetical protein